MLHKPWVMDLENFMLKRLYIFLLISFAASLSPLYAHRPNSDKDLYPFMPILNQNKCFSFDEYKSNTYTPASLHSFNETFVRALLEDKQKSRALGTLRELFLVHHALTRDDGIRGVQTSDRITLANKILNDQIFFHFQAVNDFDNNLKLCMEDQKEDACNRLISDDNLIFLFKSIIDTISKRANIKPIDKSISNSPEKLGALMNDAFNKITQWDCR